MISHRRDAVPTPGDPNAPTGREPLDIRLAAGAAASWLAVSVCVDRSAGSALLVAVCAGVGGALVLLIGARRVLGAAAIALALFCVALVLLPLAGRIAHARASALVLLARAHAAVTVTVTVQADPRVLAASGPAGAPRVVVQTSADSVLGHGSWMAADDAVLVLADAAPWRDVLPGQQMRLDGDLNPDLGGGVLSVTLFARAPPQLIGQPPW